MHTKILGLTGGIACGKSTVAKLFAQQGAFIVDADAISHQLTAPHGLALPLLLETFGSSIFASDGTLDRKALGQLVFGDASKKQQLDALMHPLIETEMQKQIEIGRKNGVPVVVLDVPLLFEANLSHLCDEIICVSASPQTQIKRIIARDGLTEAQARQRMQSQWDTARKEALSDVVFSTENNPDLQKNVQAFFGKES